MSGRPEGIKKALLFALISCWWNADLYVIRSVVLAVSVQAPDSVMTCTYSISVPFSLLCHRRNCTRWVSSLCWAFCPSGVSILTLCDPKGWSPAGSSFHDSQAKIQWGAIPFSWGCFDPGLNPGLHHCFIIYTLSHQGSPQNLLEIQIFMYVEGRR